MEWISVEERLPKPDDAEYLVCLDGLVTCLYYGTADDLIHMHGYNKFPNWYTYDDGGAWKPDGLITHWMPLPAPPEGR